MGLRHCCWLVLGSTLRWRLVCMKFIEASCQHRSPGKREASKGWAEGDLETVTSKGSAHPTGSSGAGMFLLKDPELKKKGWPFHPCSHQALLRQWAWPWVSTGQGSRGRYSWYVSISTLPAGRGRHLTVLKVGAPTQWHTTTSIIDSKFKHSRDNQIMVQLPSI